jgi:hypothetical protein
MVTGVISNLSRQIFVTGGLLHCLQNLRRGLLNARIHLRHLRSIGA